MMGTQLVQKQLKTLQEEHNDLFDKYQALQRYATSHFPIMCGFPIP